MNPSPASPIPIPATLRQGLLGFAYWLAFLLVLEPDNLLRASHAGHALQAGHEALRMAGASTLGAAATPFMLRLARRYPLVESGAGGLRWRHAALQLAGVLATALILILLSCVLAAWGFMHQWLPSAADIRAELISNGLLLVFALSAFQLLAHLLRRPAPAPAPATAPAAAPSPVPYLARVPVKTLGRLSYLDLADVSWIETQGNYLALHTGPATHLIRETAARFETQLDPARFVRIHRRILLAIPAIRDLRPEANGDATVRLHSGQELPVSRRYREALRQRMASGGGVPG